MKTPIILLTLERPIQLKEMIDSIVCFTEKETYEIIICDNGSTQPEMIEYLKSIESKHKVIYNNKNLIFKGFNPALSLVETDFFIMSDPDIVLKEGIPSNWIELMQNFLKEVNVPKVGVALDLNDIDINAFAPNKKIYDWEKSLYKKEKLCKSFPDPYYEVMTDTTLCMYRRDTFDYWNVNSKPQIEIFDRRNIISQNRYNNKYLKNPARIGGRFVSRHLGWRMATDDKYKLDWEYYREAIKNKKIDGFVPSTSVFHMNGGT
jgi:glycosyltransferase involved in cell wall biosynthesis